MLIKPPLPFILVYLFVSILFFHLFYRIWFDIDKLRNEYLANVSKLPAWYPFRNHYIRRLENKRSWDIEQKILSVIGLITILGSDVVLIAAFFIGK